MMMIEMIGQLDVTWIAIISFHTMRVQKTHPSSASGTPGRSKMWNQKGGVTGVRLREKKRII
jgi:hypothetical protein